LGAVTRCGVVALAGRPNAGKSTLLNALVGEPLAIVSPKPQTTREPVRGLISDETTQIILVDPAGLMDPNYALQRAMLRQAVATIQDADLILHVHPLNEAPIPALARELPEGTRIRAPVLTVYTKSDLVAKPADRIRDLHSTVATVATVAAGEASSILWTSATTKKGIPDLLAAIRARLPEGPFLYDAEDIGTQPLRFFAAEFVREAAYAELEQEVPYSLAVVIDEFRESETPVYIRATLAVERDSQKPIVLGKGGRTIKAIGMAARIRLEAMLDRRVRLELWVTVWPRWRKDPAALARLGLPLAPESS
jgi:GTP-binding protein Era